MTPAAASALARLAAARAPAAAHPLRVYLPLLLVGALAGLVHALARTRADPGRRRLLDITWILVLLVGAPAWLFLAAALGWL